MGKIARRFATASTARTLYTCHSVFRRLRVKSAFIELFAAATNASHFEQFGRGEIRVICNVATLTTGIDLDVRCLIDARPTRSEIVSPNDRARPPDGEGQRQAARLRPQRQSPTPRPRQDEIHHDALDDGSKRSGADKARAASDRPLRVCDSCKAVLQRTQMHCDLCGALKEAKTAVVTNEGELVEFGSKARSKPLPPSVVEKVNFYGQLKGFAAEKGYKPGWIGHKFKEKFGFWPDDPAIRGAPTMTPGLKLRQWILSRTIAFARGRKHG